MIKEDCIFCKIAAGEIPSYTLYEDENFRVILDIEPSSKGHALIIPKNHADNLFQLDDEDAAKTLNIAKKVGALIKEKLKCDGMNILQNNGEAAGQTVHHFHMHLIPRYNKDNVKVGWDHEAFDKEWSEKFAEEIKRSL